jgi:iron(III) transport system substrate-binding protein
MDTISANYLSELAAPLLDPNKRMFIGYLGAALIIALGIQTFLTRSGIRQALANLFSSRVWLSRSAKADYKVLFVNQALMMGIGPRLVSKLAIATLLFESLHIWLDGRTILLSGAPAWVISGSFTFSIFLMDDVSKYLVHRALHQWSILWPFHKVHHTAETLTPLTIYRTHPVEALIFSLRSIIVQALAIGTFLFFFGTRVEIYTVLGANILLFLFNIVGSNLRHSHVRITYGRFLEHIFISPAQHQVHHSAAHQHHDRNFGAVLAIWDWVGGSLTTAEQKQSLRFGVNSSQAADHTIKGIYLKPFVDAARILIPPQVQVFSKMKFIFQNVAIRFSLIGIFTFLTGLGVSVSPAFSGELNIYSHRQPFLIKPFLDAYSEATGTKMNVVYASKGLAQRLQAEGPLSPADVILTVDIGRLSVYADKNLLAPIKSQVLFDNVPEHLRDPNSRWFSMSKRARIIVSRKASVDTSDILSYEDLADPRWKGRICMRPGSHVYNRALMASMIIAKGPSFAEKWGEGLVKNLARRPQGNDRAQVKAIYEGVCDIAVINNYYFGKLKYSQKKSHKDWANAVNIIFPNQNGRGTHINISGGGVAKHSKRKQEAIRFLEFLTSETAQKLYGTINFEYPVNPKVTLTQELNSWGKFKEDSVLISNISNYSPKAQMLIDRIGW